MEDILKQVTKSINLEDVAEIKFPTIAACIICKNEGDKIGELIQSLINQADEVCVVDTGSTDNTVEILKGFEGYSNFKLGFDTWEDDFAKARNASIALATTDYIIWLDADDKVGPDLIKNLQYHMLDNPNTGVYLKLVNVKPDSIDTSIQLRVFPHAPHVEFQGTIHEQISFSIERQGFGFSYSQIEIAHYGYADESVIQKKLQRNYRMLLKEVKTEPDNFMYQLNFARTALALNRIGQANKAVDTAIKLFKEGRHNVALSDVLPAYLIKMNILGTMSKVEETAEMMEGVRMFFNDQQMYRFSVGEAHFHTKNYKKAYQDFKYFVTHQNLTMSEIPVDPQALAKVLIQYLMVTGLATGDYDLIDLCVQKITADSKFKMCRTDTSDGSMAIIKGA